MQRVEQHILLFLQYHNFLDEPQDFDTQEILHELVTGIDQHSVCCRSNLFAAYVAVGEVYGDDP